MALGSLLERCVTPARIIPQVFRAFPALGKVGSGSVPVASICLFGKVGSSSISHLVQHLVLSVSFSAPASSQYPELVEYHARIAELPGIKEYLAGPKRLPAINANKLG